MGEHRHDDDNEDSALAQLLEARYDAAFRTAYLIVGNRDDAEDAVREAFLRAWRFRAALGTGTELTPWLYRVVVRSCCSRLRRDGPHQARRPSPGTDGANLPYPGGPDPAVWRAEVGGDVLRALGALPVPLRVVVVLRYYGGLTERDIAIAIARRPGAVKARLHEARRRLAAHDGIRVFAPDTPEPFQEAVR